MNDIPNISGLLYSHRLKRSYKTLCSISGCSMVTHVQNSSRIGGMCLNCRIRLLASWKITRWTRKELLKRKLNQRLYAFLVVLRCMPRNSGGHGSGISLEICKYL